MQYFYCLNFCIGVYWYSNASDTVIQWCSCKFVTELFRVSSLISMGRWDQTSHCYVIKNNTLIEANLPPLMLRTSSLQRSMVVAALWCGHVFIYLLFYIIRNWEPHQSWSKDAPRKMLWNSWEELASLSHILNWNWCSASSRSVTQKLNLNTDLLIKWWSLWDFC